jgi:hypothetical protein
MGNSISTLTFIWGDEDNGYGGVIDSNGVANEMSLNNEVSTMQYQ